MSELYDSPWTPVGVYAVRKYGPSTRPKKPLTPIKEFIYNGRYYECDWCKMFKAHHLNSIRKHKLRDHKGLAENPVTSGKRPRACKLCDFVTYSSRSYGIHLEFDHEKPKFECPWCENETFKLLKDLYEHMNTNHYGQCPCEVCGVLLTTMEAVEAHLRNKHSSDKKTENAKTCDICQKVLSKNKDFLRRHILRHFGISKKKVLDPCPLCGKLISRGEGMKQHMEVHANVKNFSCNVCGKAFLRQTTLRIHMRTHTGEKPFKCTVCGKSFSQKSPLNTHMKRIHGQSCGSKL